VVLKLKLDEDVHRVPMEEAKLHFEGKGSIDDCISLPRYMYMLYV
jgi:hypothetical protein